MVAVNGLVPFRSYFWAFYLFGIAVGAYLLADISNFFVASYLEKSIVLPQPVFNPSHQKAPVVTGGKFDYRSIIRGNLFDQTMGIFIPPAPRPVLAPTPIPIPIPLPPPVVIPKAPLNIKLIGTVIGADSPPYAVIEDSRSRRQSLYRVGDFLSEDAKIKRIERNRVFITRGNEEIVLDLTGLTSTNIVQPAFEAQEVIPASIPPPRGGVRPMGNGQWVIDRAEIDYAVNHLPELLTKARVIPNFTDGKADGFRIFAIRQDSIYSKIGLQDGDILKQVNDIDVRNPQNFLQVFEQLKNERRITINLVRNNKDEVLNYNIR